MTRPRPNALWRPRLIDKALARVEKPIDAWRYRAWFANKEFTTDWTTGNLSRWRRILSPWRDAPLRILELGSWEGRSATFFLNFFPHATMVAVDAFSEFPEIEGRFDRNLAPFRDRLEKIKSVSFPALDALAAQGRVFDLVYIDADHVYEPVRKNSLGAWRVTSAGSVIIWDDYRFGLDKPKEQQAKTAIDEFLREREGAWRLLGKGYQVMIERTG